jgi:hypothetical protein
MFKMKMKPLRIYETDHTSGSFSIVGELCRVLGVGGLGPLLLATWGMQIAQTHCAGDEFRFLSQDHQAAAWRWY